MIFLQFGIFLNIILVLFYLIIFYLNAIGLIV